MKHWIRKKCVIGALAGLLSLPAAAQEDELTDLPGYVDFGELTSVYGEPRVMINIGGLLLGLASAATQDDPEASALLSDLKGVRINIYSTGGEVTPALDQVAQVKSMLQAADWEPVVQVNEQDEQMQMFLKADAEGMQGLTIMAVNDEEAVFVNILGAIDPAKISQVMHSFDVDVDVDVDAD